jgi:hypothetical protein
MTKPFSGKIGCRGHVPWPDWIVEEVLRTSWEDLQRMVRLGIMTCQRESDLVRLGPMHCESVKGRGKGIWCRPKKTRRRRRSVFIPLRTADALELSRWGKTPILFQNSRWKAPYPDSTVRFISILPLVSLTRRTVSERGGSDGCIQKWERNFARNGKSG